MHEYAIWWTSQGCCELMITACPTDKKGGETLYEFLVRYAAGAGRVSINYQRYEWISYKLNREAYRQQMKGRDKPLKQFIPCEAALCFTRAMGQDPIPPSSVVLIEASRAHCRCHPGLGLAQLDDLYGEAVRAIPTPLAQEPQP